MKPPISREERLGDEASSEYEIVCLTATTRVAPHYTLREMLIAATELLGVA